MPDQNDFDGPAITRGRSPERQADKPKNGLNPMKLAAVAVTVVLVTLAWMFRWDVTPTHTGSGSYPTAFLLNRWTGTLYLVAENKKYEVKSGEKQ